MMLDSNLIKMYEKLLAKKNKASSEFNDFVNQIKGQCHHPEKYQYSRIEDRDNGYGTWWKSKLIYCKICGQYLRNDGRV